MPTLRLRDRDAIVTREGLVFRVFGYSHPPNAYICDVEYAPAELFQSDNPRAPRTDGRRVFCKFYEDEGWNFVRDRFPQYLVFNDALRKNVVAVNRRHISEVRKPDEKLEIIISKNRDDSLLNAMQSVLKLASERSGLSFRDFGVFGSILHGFHHPRFSDIDLVVYGRSKLIKLCKSLQELYTDRSSLSNEFETDKSVKGKRWKFQNLSPEEFVWHQRRKLVYAVFNDRQGERIIKTEFEPVKDWKEIKSDYDPRAEIVQKGWVKMYARITCDDDAPFIPSVYKIEPLRVLAGSRDAAEVIRIVSYMDEFRMQAHRDETIYAEGNLEEVSLCGGSLHQIALTYCARYYEQVLKVASRS